MKIKNIWSLQKEYKNTANVIACLLVSGVCWPHHAIAEAMVTKIEGNNYEVMRLEYPLDISPLSLLKPNDIVAITKDDTSIQISLEGSELVLDTSNTPYKIPEPEDVSIFNKTLKVALSRFQEFMNNESTTQLLISRGTAKPIKLFGVGSDTNNLPKSLQMFRLFFDGGNVPLLVNLENQNSEIVFSAEITGDFIGIPLKHLSEGNYKLSIGVVGNEKSQIVTSSLKIVSDDEMPIEVKNILSEVESPAREQLVAILLSEDKDWHFAAVQYAYLANELNLVTALINRNR